ncbi:MAG: protein kinase [Nitrospinae bacterium]|nr:protein kinase [Nitrospinota bacterium]
MADIPEYIGRYRLHEMIGRGGMGKIYRATDELIGRDVAVKITDTSSPTPDNLSAESVMRQFSMEMQISGQMSHHNFVTIYDAGMEGSLCYLVMELLDGVSLDKVIQGKTELKLDIRQKLDALIQVAKALHFSHQRGVVHRDIKPSNIMYLNNGLAKVLDFGVASVSEGSGIRLTVKPIPGYGGTPYYMSPEQINRGAVDFRTDLFSLAVVAYELLTGDKPFTADNLFNLYERILRIDPIPMREINSSVPEKVAAIVGLCLNKDAALRLPSCLAFADQLDEVVNESFLEGDNAVISQDTLATLRKYRASFTFFFDLEFSQIYKLLQVCQLRKHKAGEMIFREGEVARDMHLIIAGSVKICRGPTPEKSITIHTLKRGDIFGEMGIIDGGPRSASAIAEGDCQTLVLHQVSLLRCDANTAGKLYRNLAHILSAKLRITSGRLADFVRETNL